MSSVIEGEAMDVSVGAARLLASRRRALAQLESVSADAGEIDEIDAALQRIVAGTYGVCEICGHAIGRDRLRSLPEVRRCIICSG